MSTYLEIKPGTKEHENAERVLTWKDAWQTPEVLKEFENLLGIDPIDNLKISTGCLLMSKITDELRYQFKPKLTKEGNYRAKTNSQLNKDYLKLITKLNLKTYSIYEFSNQFGFNVVETLFPIVMPDKSHRFFIKIRDSSIYGTELEEFKIKNNQVLTEVKEWEYLQLRVDMLKALDQQQQKSEEKEPQK